VGGAYVPAFFAGMYALLRCAHTRKQHVCPAGDTIQRGAYITTRGVATYAPPAIYYIHDWAHPIDSLQEQYLLAQSKLPGGVRKVEIQDPEAEWANGNAALISG
jgi:hypothetical protein